MPAFPVDLRVGDRPVLVVGGGKIASRRVDALLAAAARVTVVAPVLSPALEAHLQAGRLVVRRRAFVAGDCAGFFLVLSAVDDPEVGPRVWDDAKAHGALCAVVDVPHLCDVFFGAVGQRGIITLGVFSDGRAPGLLGRLRDDLLGRLDAQRLEQAAGFAELRRQLHELDRDPTQQPRRAAFLARYNTGAALDGLRVPGAIARALATYRGAEETPATAVGKVVFVGAGPGAADLLTLRAKRHLEAAEDLVVDGLVPAEVYADLKARLFVVDKRQGTTRPEQDEISALLVELARAGRQVVRLKAGDPGVFGRLAEELQALRAAAVPYELVPGVSSALAAPLGAAIPVTEREQARRVVIVSAQQVEGSALPLSLPAYAADQTVLLMMGLRRLGELADSASAAGYPEDLPAAIVSRVSWPDERTVVGSVGSIAAVAGAAGLESPAVVILGPVVGFAEAYSTVSISSSATTLSDSARSVVTPTAAPSISTC